MTAIGTQEPAPPAPAEVASNALEVRGLCKSFKVPRVSKRSGASDDPRRRREGLHDRLDVLSDIDFQIPKGQTVGLIGVNGSGKTTLLKILAGVMEAAAGDVQTRGRIGALLELGAGFHPELTGYENVHLNGAVLGLGRRRIEQFLANIIEFSGLERFMDMPVKFYSSGMVVRLGFAVATQLDPDLLLLDETFAVGDAQFQNRALGRIHAMKRAGVTMLLVSHNAELILEFADRVLWLDRGRLRMDDDPRRVLAAYQRESAAILKGTEKLTSWLLGEAEFVRIRPEASSVRIAGAALEFARDGQVQEARAEDVPEIESGDDLHLRLDLEMDEKSRLSDYELTVFFRRDDRRVVAQSSVRLGNLPPPERPPVAANGDAIRRELRLTYAPVRLAKGEYRVALTLGPPQQGGREAYARHEIEKPFRVITPLPYNNDEFRVGVNWPARWEPC